MVNQVLVFAFLIALVSVVVSSDSFAEKYGYQKAMCSCLGDEVYYGWQRKVMAAKKACYMEPISMMGQDLAALMPSEAEVTLRRRREEPAVVSKGPLYDAECMSAIVHMAKAKVSNFTCTLTKLGAIDENYNINTAMMVRETLKLNIDAKLKVDLVKVIGQCEQFSMCLPEDKTFTGLPVGLKRVMAFVECKKKMKLCACMKHDLRKHLNYFDVSSFPGNQADEEEMVDKLLYVLWGVEEKEAFELS